MIGTNHATCLRFILAVILFSPRILAAQCTIDSNVMDRGETKTFIVCGTNIPRSYTLKGLSEANIAIEYQHYLEMCGIGIATPGIHLILKAKDDAKPSSVGIVNADTKEPVCENLSIAVPDRIHVLEASLEDTADPSSPLKVLTIKAGTSQDLSQACAEGLSFPEGTWPSLSLLSREDFVKTPAHVKSSLAADQPLLCTESSIKAVVKVYGQQRHPAKAIISKVKASGGQEKEGVAYVTLPPPQWASSMRDEDAKYIDVNGVRTRCFDKGEGEALLFVHGGQAGAGDDAQIWQQNFDYLSNYFHVYALDRLGSGYTDNPKTDEDYEKYYEQVVAHLSGFIRAVGMKKLHLIGHSQGGWLAMRAALDHSDIAKSLVIVDSGMGASDPSSPTMPFMMYIMFYVNPPEGPTRESIRRGLELWSYTKNNITDDAVRRGLTLARLPKMIEARDQMIKHMISPGHPSFLALRENALEETKQGKLKAPILVVQGYNDFPLPYEGGIEFFRYVIASVPQSRLVIFNNSGHYPLIEHPELFNRTIKSFCGAYASPPID
jgi:2-hydroxy-6-oxonona-2,4-dienedioate hydrolase